jgi:hypothetical protein
VVGEDGVEGLVSYPKGELLVVGDYLL